MWMDLASQSEVSEFEEVAATVRKTGQQASQRRQVVGGERLVD